MRIFGLMISILFGVGILVVSITQGVGAVASEVIVADEQRPTISPVQGDNGQTLGWRQRPGHPLYLGKALYERMSVHIQTNGAVKCRGLIGLVEERLDTVGILYDHDDIDDGMRTLLKAIGYYELAYGQLDDVLAADEREALGDEIAHLSELLLSWVDIYQEKAVGHEYELLAEMRNRIQSVSASL